MNNELLPCPFCGGEAGVMKANGVHQAYCAETSCIGNECYETHEDAVKAWNTRADKAAPVESDDLQNAVNCLKAAIDVVKIGAVPNIDLLYVVEEILSQPKQSAPVERIELLENSLSWFDKFIAENGLDENGGLLRIRKAARAYLALQGGDHD